MLAMPLLTNQFKKLTTFIYILIFLFIVNIIFNLNFKWEGIAIIVNIYLYVFSFYLIFNFSLIEIPLLKSEYREKYGRFGDYLLFIKTRVIPFVVIYLVTVVYTLINFLDKGNWPWQPILELLDGRFSNVVFYSLILLIILKLNRKPRITIPLFIAGAIIYFAVYQLMVNFTPSGVPKSGLKFFQITIAIFFIIYEFISDKKKIMKSISASVLIGIFLYFSFVGTSFLIYRFSSFASFPQARSAQILLRLGYSFPLSNFKSIVIETSAPFLLYDLVYYSNEYKRGLSITTHEWENLLLSGSMEVANIIAFYLTNKNITLSYKQVFSYAERRSIDSGEILLNSMFYTKYASRYCNDNIEDFFEKFKKGNKYYRIWAIRVTAESKSIDVMPYLISMLTDIDSKISEEAYSSLTKITETDPAKKLDVQINSPEVIKNFNEFYQNSRSID